VKKGKNFGRRENTRTFKTLTVNSDEASEQFAAMLRFFEQKILLLLSVSPRLHAKVPIHNVSNHLLPSEKNVSHTYISDYTQQR
jgi:hypothetical protein